MSLLLHRLRATRPLSSPAIRRYSTEPPQNQAPSPSPAAQQAQQTQPPTNPHAKVYREGGPGRAIAWNFLVAMATFQALYWSWLKLESLEVKKEKNEELQKLEGEVRGLVAGKK